MKVYGVLNDAYRVLAYKLLVLLIVMVVAALLEGGSMLLVLPLFSVMGMADNANGTGIEHYIDVLFDSLGVSSSATLMLVVVVAAFGVQMCVSVFQIWVMARLQRSYCAHWQNRLFRAYMESKWIFLAASENGVLVNSLSQESVRTSAAFMITMQIASGLIVTLVYCVFACLLSVKITSVLMGMATVLFLLLKGLASRNYSIGRLITQLNGKFISAVGEYIKNSKLVKATSSENIAINHTSEYIDQLRILQTKATFYPGFSKSLFEFMAIATLCVTVPLFQDEILSEGTSIILILAMFVRLVPRLNSMQQNFQYLSVNLPALEDLKRHYEAADSYRESISLTDNDPLSTSREIAFDKVSLGYGEKVILRNLTFHLPGKGLVGVVGESGSGKSTLVNSILGLSEVVEGSIRIGAEIVGPGQQTTQSLRRTIGYVPQETLLFNRSLAENIAWYNPGATKEEIELAAKRAHAESFIAEMPEGYGAIIGDDGVRLSGGQRQRVGLARAILHNPSILILDEPTSALDSKAEEIVFEALSELKKRICVVVVAHRLSTLRNADKIITIANGEISGIGNWDMLAGTDPVLQSIASKQLI